MSGRTYEGWIAIYTTGTDYEADLIRDRLDDAGMPAVVLTQRDHAFNLTVGDFAQVRVMVPPEHVAEARALLESAPISDADLEAAAMAADPNLPDAHPADREAMLDSGIDKINLSVPDADDDDA